MEGVLKNAMQATNGKPNDVEKGDIIEMPANFLKDGEMVNPKTVNEYYSAELDDND